jgi:hypothetical protein
MSASRPKFGLVAAAQVFLVVALIGHVVAYRRHRDLAVLALAAVGVALVLGSLWIAYVEALVYAGPGAVVAATVWSVFALRRCATCATVSAQVPPGGDRRRPLPAPQHIRASPPHGGGAADVDQVVLLWQRCRRSGPCERRSSSYGAQQELPPACIGGHRAEPYEQNTQQSPAFGRSNVPHCVHS